MKTNPQLEFARKYVEQTNVNVFLTGKAGTGKTTFLKSLKDTLFKRYVVLAPTGIAALNCEGVTIHSFFQLGFSPYIPGYSIEIKKYRASKINLIRSLDLIIIDEISMVRADVLDQIDLLLRKFRPSQRYKPFGGVQILMVGDLSQLPPVARQEEWEVLQQYYQTPYFFSAKVLQESRYLTITLEHIYRQTDYKFVNILNHIRDNKITNEVIAQLNERYNPKVYHQDNEGCIVLCSHNHQANGINEQRLKDINKKLFTFKADVKGDFDEKLFPNSEVLELKEGAQVMFLKNDYDSTPRRYYNGTIGHIVEISDDKIVVKKDEDGEEISVSKYTWERSKYELDKKTKEITTDIIGTFTQYPLRLAWAITIHKSQGLTFEKAIIDAENSFAHGQFYVALSRCRSLEGLQLSKRFNIGAVITDVVVDNYNIEQQNNKPTEESFSQDKYQYFAQNIKDVFDFNQILYYNNDLFKKCEIDVKYQIGEKWQEFKSYYEQILIDIVHVGQRFQKQLDKIIVFCSAKNDRESLFKRALEAKEYFLPKFDIIYSMFLFLSNLELEEVEDGEDIDTLMHDFMIEVEIKHRLFDYLSDKRFVFKEFLNYKNKLSAEGDKLEFKSYKNFIKVNKTTKQETPKDLELNDLYQQLKNWRKEKAGEENLPAFCVLSNATLQNIVINLPKSLKELSQIKGVGEKLIKKYGEEILAIIDSNT